MKEAAELAESTQILLNVSEFTDVSAATDSLISTVQAFKYTAEESMSVVDILNTIGNNYAISTADLAQSLTKSSSALVAANGTLEEAVALTAAANTTIQDADVVGTALKTISMRLRGTSLSEMEEDGLDTEGYTTQSKLRGTVKSVTGIDILTDTGAYKSTYQILAEIAEVWDDITDDKARAGLLEALAGKRSGSVVAAILQNPDVLKNAFESAKGAQGSAQAELEKYMDSIQGRLDQFTNSLQSMWNNVLDDDLVKFIVQAGTELLKFIDSLGVVKTLVIGIGTYLIQKNFKGDLFGGLFNAQTVDEARDRLKNLQVDIANLQKEGKKPKKIERKQNQANTLKASIGKYDELSKQLTKNRIDADAAKRALDDYNESLAKKYSKKKNQGKSPTVAETAEVERLQKAYDGANDEVIKTETALKQAEVQAKATGTAGWKSGLKFADGFKAALGSIKETLKSMAYMMAITAVFEAIGTIGTWISDAFKNADDSAEALQEKLDELRNELSSVESELNSLQSELKDTDERIEELMSQGSLTFVEQEELNKLKSVSAELKAQIELQENLRKSMQQGVNSASIEATDAYLDTSFMSEKSKSERQEKAGETGEGVGQIIGTALGALGFLGTPLLGAALMAVGSTVGSTIGKWIGEWTVGAVYDSEQSVGEAMDNMLAERNNLLQDQKDALASGDAEAYNEATEALRTYDAQMAKHISQIQQNYNAMDWETADPETRKEMMEYADWLDAYNISMKTEGAKSNAIARIFGDEASEELKEIKSSIESALDAGENVDFMDFEDEKYDAFKERLYGMGLTITDVVAYFEALKVAKDAAMEYDTFDTVKEIAKYEDGISALKDAFDEFNESGAVAAATLIKLNEVFGNVEGWQKYVDVMSTGTASTEEAMKVTNDLAEALMDNILSNPFDFVDKIENDDGTVEYKKNLDEYTSYLTAIQQLRSIGVTNAKELVDAKQQEAMVKQVVANIKRVQELEAKGTLTEAEQAELTELKKDNYEEYAKAVEDVYGVEIKNTDLIKKQVMLSATQTELKKYQDFNDAFFADNTKWTDYKTNAENIKSWQSLVDDANEVIDYAKNMSDGELLWDTIQNFFGDVVYSDPYTSIIDKLREAEKTISQYPTEIQKAKDASKQYFDELTTFAEENEISLDGIDTTKFDATDISENSIFKQVYDRVSQYIGDKKVELEQIEADIKAQLNTAFDDIGLEVILELQDKDKLVDDIQSIYDELANAQKEYAENGYISVDTMQSLLKLEPKYLDMLVDEEGKLNLDKQALQEVARARIIDLGIKQQTAIYEQALALATNGSKNALLEYISTMETATVVGQDWHEQQLELISDALTKKVLDKEITQEEANAFIAGIKNQITAVQTVTQSALDNLNNSLSTSGNTATEEANNAFQDAMDYWENRIGAAESRFEQIQHEIDMLEAQGKKAGAGYYQEQIKQLQEFDSAGNLVGGKLYLLNQQLAEATEMLSDPNIKEGDSQWWEIANTINDIEAEIDDTTLSIQDLKDAMADTHWYMFDEAHDRISTLASDLENIRNILSNEKLFDDEGNFTEAGLGTLATYVQDLGVFEGALANAKAEMDLFGDSYDPNKKYVDLQGNDLSIDSEQDWYDAAKKAEEKYDDWNSKVIETRYNIKDLYEQQIDAVEEYTQTLVENYNEYIDAVKEALDSERDLYEFKKSTEQKSKNMAALERRIASLSGSTNAADVAERRKLQAELTDAKSDMDDHYYSHAKEQQSQALDDEVTAYETAMNAYIEGLRTKLEESTAELYMSYEEMGTETKSFIDGVTQSVVLNAGNVKDVYLATGETIDDSLMTPWVNAAAAIGAFSSSEGALGLMNSWTEAKAGKPFYDFQTKASAYLSTPWSSVVGAGGAVEKFKTSVTSVMSQIVSDVNTNVSGINGYISGLKTEIDKIKDTTIRITTHYETTGTPPGGGDGSDDAKTPEFKAYSQNSSTWRIGKKSYVEGRATTINGAKYYLAPDGCYYPMSKLQKVWDDPAGYSVYGFPAGTTNYKYYAKGTMGTTNDQWMLTDELGDELVMYATPEGTLSYARVGTTVVPADITRNLVEWGKLNPNMMSMPNATPNINMISNAVNKPEFNFNVDKFLHCDNVTQDSLPELKQFVKTEMNNLVKQMNYAIKGKGGR